MVTVDPDGRAAARRWTRTVGQDARPDRSTACRSGSRTSSTSPACPTAGAAAFAHTRPTRDADSSRAARAGAIIVGKTVRQFACKDPARR
jgi:hypothetical protein